jgi:hypothetical protein
LGFKINYIGKSSRLIFLLQIRNKKNCVTLALNLIYIKHEKTIWIKTSAPKGIYIYDGTTWEQVADLS